MKSQFKVERHYKAFRTPKGHDPDGMIMIDLSKENFREVVGADGIVLVYCWATHCRVCAQFDPVFAQAAADHPQHVLARMNILTDDNLGAFFEIEHTPTLMLYRDGLLLLKKPGNFSAEELGDILKQAESLDMNRVRSDLEHEARAADPTTHE